MPPSRAQIPHAAHQSARTEEAFRMRKLLQVQLPSLLPQYTEEQWGQLKLFGNHLLSGSGHFENLSTDTSHGYRRLSSSWHKVNHFTRVAVCSDAIVVVTDFKGKPPLNAVFLFSFPHRSTGMTVTVKTTGSSQPRQLYIGGRSSPF